MNFATDTHALIWWFTSSPRISSKAVEIYNRCELGETVIFIPSIVIAEALSFFDKKQVSFDFKKLFKKIYESEKFIIIPLYYSVLQKMVTLNVVMNQLSSRIILSHILPEVQKRCQQPSQKNRYGHLLL